MKAVSLREPKHFEIVDVDEPQSLGAEEALVRVHRVGICGTDLSGYLGKFPFYSYPRIPGHELGVEVLQVGADVANVKPGDRCSVEPYINNPNSFASQRGRTNCCNHLQVLGVHTDGGMRPRFVVPARKLHTSTSLEYEQLALVETLAIGCHAIDRCAAAAGENLLVIRAGPVGLAVIAFAKIANATSTVLDLVPSRLEFCKETMGGDHTILFTGDGSELEAMQAVTDGNLFTAVIDATGSNRSMSHALNYVGHTGRLVFVGITTQEISFPHPLMHSREMTLLASRNALPGDFTRIIQLIENKQIDTTPWITHRTNSREVIDVFDSYTNPATGVIKAVVEIEDS